MKGTAIAASGRIAAQLQFTPGEQPQLPPGTRHPWPVGAKKVVPPLVCGCTHCPTHTPEGAQSASVLHGFPESLQRKRLSAAPTTSSWAKPTPIGSFAASVIAQQPPQSGQDFKQDAPVLLHFPGTGVPSGSWPSP